MRNFKAAILAALCALTLVNPASASDWPNKPIRVIVPFAAGAGTDVIMRHFGQSLEKALGQPVVIENKPGANGVVGTAQGAAAAPDGYNFFVISNSTVSAAPYLYKKLPYNIEKDIVPVAPFILAPSVLLANPSFPADNFDQFLAHVRSSKSSFSYGHANSVGLVSGRALLKKAKIDLTEVPYKSSPQGITDVIGSHLDFFIIDTIAASSHVRGNKVKVLAVTSAQRSPLYPDTATMAERFPGIDAYAWVGLGAPAGTPQDVIERLNREIVRIGKEKATIDYFANMGASIHSASAAEYLSFVQAQNKQWRTMLEDAGVQPQ